MERGRKREGKGRKRVEEGIMEMGDREGEEE